MVSIRYFLEVGELRRTKSTPLGERTSKRGPGPGAGVWASKLNAQNSASVPALVNRAADNSNLSQVLWIRLREIRFPNKPAQSRVRLQFARRISRSLRSEEHTSELQSP